MLLFGKCSQTNYQDTSDTMRLLDTNIFDFHRRVGYLLQLQTTIVVSQQRFLEHFRNGIFSAFVLKLIENVERYRDLFTKPWRRRIGQLVSILYLLLECSMQLILFVPMSSNPNTYLFYFKPRLRFLLQLLFFGNEICSRNKQSDIIISPFIYNCRKCNQLQVIYVT